ncbi:MAG: hypothetical protein IPJ98_12035 [Bryobacterales bacterium]|nr:hypothetical protein [Bryobacterales bacterium]
MRPQDVVVALKLCAHPERVPVLIPLSVELGISLSNAHGALKRIWKSGLLVLSEEGEVLGQQKLFDFLVHGLPYVWPAELGATARGLATAHSAPPLESRIVHSSADVLVWPDARGSVRGQSIKPLIPSVAAAARRDGELYELLALTDALRAGRARERKLAAELLEKRLLANAGAPGRARTARAVR